MGMRVILEHDRSRVLCGGGSEIPSRGGGVAGLGFRPCPHHMPLQSPPILGRGGCTGCSLLKGSAGGMRASQLKPPKTSLATQLGGCGSLQVKGLSFLPEVEAPSQGTFCAPRGTPFANPYTALHRPAGPCPPPGCPRPFLDPFGSTLFLSQHLQCKNQKTDSTV